jgi:hypothetical protein
VAEEGRHPGAPRAGRRLHPRPCPQHRYAAALDSFYSARMIEYSITAH